VKRALKPSMNCGRRMERLQTTFRDHRLLFRAKIPRSVPGSLLLDRLPRDRRGRSQRITAAPQAWENFDVTGILECRNTVRERRIRADLKITITEKLRAVFRAWCGPSAPSNRHFSSAR
jgi:hypothetical protein